MREVAAFGMVSKVLTINCGPHLLTFLFQVSDSLVRMDFTSLLVRFKPNILNQIEVTFNLLFIFCENILHVLPHDLSY
jgi:hypothetical protein